MLHVITLYAVEPEAASAFVRSVRFGGEWRALARDLAPSLIATDLLERQFTPSPPFFSNTSILFVCLDYWSSLVAYRRASENPSYQALLLARRRMASSAFVLGEFSFPAIDFGDTVSSAKSN